MASILQSIKEMDTTKLKIGGAGLVFVKLFGIGKTLFFLLGGVAGFLLAHKMAESPEKE